MSDFEYRVLIIGIIIVGELAMLIFTCLDIREK